MVCKKEKVYGGTPLSTLIWTKDDWFKRVRKMWYRNIRRHYFTYRLFSGSGHSHSILSANHKTHACLVFSSFSHGLEHLTCNPCFLRSDVWKERRRSYFVFVGQHYFWRSMTPQAFWYQRRGMQKVSQGGQGAASAARDPACSSGMTVTKHYLVNLHFCKTVTHVQKSSYTNMCHPTQICVSPPFLRGHHCFTLLWWELGTET